MSEKGQIFLSVSDTSVQDKSFPFPAVAPLILHVVQIHFPNFPPENIPVCPIWSKSEPLNTYRLGSVWEPTREAGWGEAQVGVKCLSFALTCSGHIGKIISGH